MGLLDGVKERLKRRLGVPSVERSLAALAGRGFAPRTVYDVGAYHGEFATFCRRLFVPAPRVICFEPLASALTRLRLLEASGEVTVVPGLVGDRDCDAVPFREQETASSVLDESHHAQAATARHPMRQLDTHATAGQIRDLPDLLKIDTQGYELQVLKGCDRVCLPACRVILAEVNWLDVYNGVALGSEVVGWLATRGWVTYDVCSLIRRPLDGALWQSDLLFVRHDDPLRADKRWGA